MTALLFLLILGFKSSAAYDYGSGSSNTGGGYQKRDCVMTNWSCNCNKQSGWAQCTRRIVVKNNWGGKPCGRLVNFKPCDVNCEVSSWSKWCKCSKKCGGGVTERQRHITIHKANNGRKCPSLMERKPCNKAPCPRKCKMSAFVCGPCNKKTGLYVCNRRVLVQPIITYGVNPSSYQCKPLKEIRKCKVDCEVTKFSEFNTCSATCGGGFQVAVRKVVYKNLNGGKPCVGSMEKRQRCNNEPCPRDCKMGPWVCLPCNNYTGRKICTRKILITSIGTGKKCGDKTKIERCDVDCKLTPWGPWCACSKTCGGGMQSRKRRIVYGKKHNGKVCDKLEEKRSCNTRECPVDCKQGPWECSPCNKATGKKKCTRKTLVNSAYGGKQCKPSSKIEDCPVNCEYDVFGEFKNCSVTCGGGFQVAVRRIRYIARNGGAPCTGSLEKRQRCNNQLCPVDCKVGPYVCSKCNVYTGQKLCTRKVLTATVDGGKKCPPLVKKENCDVDCKVSKWGSYCHCSKTCGGGTQYRTRRIIIKRKNNGQICPKLKQIIKCNTHVCPVPCVQGPLVCGPCNPTTGFKKCVRKTLVAPVGTGKKCLPSQEMKKCPVPCKISPFGQFTVCSKTCGGGFQISVRKIVVTPKNNGEPCTGSLEKRKSCNEQPCPRNCVQGSWSCGVCNKKSGYRTCRRPTLVTRISTGKKCGPSEEKRPCRVDCEVTPWRLWTKCSKNCGNGTQTRSRAVICQRRNGGRVCPKLNETRSCKIKECPIDCKQTRWVCKNCNKRTGLQKCERKTLVEGRYGGKRCGSCHKVKACKVDCQMAPFGEFSSCSKTCGGGFKIARRKIVYKNLNGGKPCIGSMEKRLGCNKQSCAVDCKQGAWMCGGCNKSSGKKQCMRMTLRHAVANGKACGPSMKSDNCKVDCEMGQWQHWTKCSKKCGGGKKYRTRSINYGAHNGGKKCGATKQTLNCNTQACCKPCGKKVYNCPHGQKIYVAPGRCSCPKCVPSNTTYGGGYGGYGSYGSYNPKTVGFVAVGGLGLFYGLFQYLFNSKNSFEELLESDPIEREQLL